MEEPMTIEAAKELLKCERQIAKVEAILLKLRVRREELIHIITA
jgi:hypothetical protein